MNKVAVIVLAAGKGTRLAQGSPSPKPKVLYEVGGKPLILHTLNILKHIGLENVILVIGHKGGFVQQAVGASYKFAVQSRRLGTGHAAKVGLTQVPRGAEHVMVLNGDDSAFYKPETVKKVLDKHFRENNTITFVTLEPKDPTGLGRIVRKEGKVVGIVEERVATEEQKKIKEVNDGLYLFDRNWIEKNLSTIKKNQVGEYYLTDLVHLALEKGEKVETYKLDDPSEWKGVNTPEELKEADDLMKKKDKRL